MGAQLLKSWTKMTLLQPPPTLPPQTHPAIWWGQGHLSPSHPPLSHSLTHNNRGRNVPAGLRSWDMKWKKGPPWGPYFVSFSSLPSDQCHLKTNNTGDYGHKVVCLRRKRHWVKFLRAGKRASHHGFETEEAGMSQSSSPTCPFIHSLSIHCITTQHYLSWKCRPKGTGQGPHCLGAYILVSEVKVKVAQSCPTLWDSMDYAVHGILQARILEWVAFPFSRGSSQPRDRTQVSHIAGGFFTSWATRKASTS